MSSAMESVIFLTLLSFQIDPFSEVRMLEDLLQKVSDFRIKRLEVCQSISKN